MRFLYTAFPARVVFERGGIEQVAAEVNALHCRRVLVLCSPRRRALAERIATLLGERSAGIFDQAESRVPMHTAVAARAAAWAQAADGVVAVGGGSAIGLGKAISRNTGLPIVAIPSTYAGSEMTPIYGVTENGQKITGRDPRVLPRTVIYDVDLTLELPLSVSMTSGLNAIAHAAEGLYARQINPIIRLMAAEGIRALAEGLPGVHSDKRHIKARTQCQYGAWLCATVLGQVGMGLHHKLCHTLSGSLNLPHAPTHAIILPHALAYNADAAPDAMATIARALNVYDAPEGLYDLARSLGVQIALNDLGMPAESIEHAAALASHAQYPNPRPLEIPALIALLSNAWAGRPPSRLKN